MVDVTAPSRLFQESEDAERQRGAGLRRYLAGCENGGNSKGHSKDEEINLHVIKYAAQPRSLSPSVAELSEDVRT